MPISDSRPKAKSKSGVENLYSADAETAVLGCMLLNADEVIPEVNLERRDFFVPAHKEIFDCLIDLYNSGTGIDSLAVHHWLEDRKLDKQVGSPGILGALMGTPAIPLTVATHVRRIKERSALRILQEACATISADIAEMPDSVASILDRAQTVIADATAIAKADGEENFAEVVDKTSRDAIEFSEMGGGLRGHSTGMAKLDEILGGWCPNQLVVIGASMGVGKTALVLTFLRHLLKKGIGSGMFSMEMSPKQLVNRILSGESIIGGRAILNGTLTEEQQRVIRATADNVRNWPFYLDCTQGLEIQQMRSRARRWKRKYGIQALGIDFAQIARSRRFSENKVLEVADIARNCKEMATELDLTVFLLSQLNCDSDEVPTKTSLKDSKAIAEAADVILLVHEESRDSEGDWRRYILNVAKQREGVDGKKFYVSYLAWRTHFEQSRQQ